MDISISHYLYGIFISLLLGAFFSLFGALCLPRKILSCLGTPFYPAFFGGAIFVLLSSYSIKNNISLSEMFNFFLLPLFCLLSLLRMKQWPFFFGLFQKDKITIFCSWLGMYVVIYSLVFLFLPQLSDKSFFPITRIGNDDLFLYINITDYMIHLGNSNISSMSFIPNYHEFAGTIDLFALFSAFYCYDSLAAALPLMYSLIALSGILMTYAAHHYLDVSKKMALCLVVIVISGTFYRYIIGEFFLGSCVCTTVLLGLFLELTNLRKIEFKKSCLMEIIAKIMPYEILLFFVYPVLFIANIMMLLVFFILGRLFPISWKTIKTTIKEGTYLLLCVITSLILLFIIEPSFFQFVISNAIKGATRPAGWPLPLLSPWMIIGLPSPLLLKTKGMLILNILTFSIVFLYASIQLIKGKLNHHKGQSFLAFGLFVLCCYWILFFLKGPTYQVWKIISYYALPCAFSLWWFFIKVLSDRSILFGAWINNRREHIIFSITVLFILCDKLFFGFSLQFFPKNHLEELSALNTLKTPSSDLWVHMSDDARAFLAIHFIQNKTLHLLNHTYYSQEKNLTALSNSTAPTSLFWETKDNCLAGQQIKHIGCLYVKLPTSHWNINYKLNHSYPFLVLSGFWDIEQQGFWSDSKDSSMILYVNAHELKKHLEGYVNFKVEPFLYQDLTEQTVTIQWGKNHVVTKEISKPQFIRLPYTQEDWKNTQLEIHWHFSNAISPSQLDPNSPDTRPLALYFTQLSLQQK